MYHNEQELYHFGVKGMRWGHRKAVQKSDLRNRYDKAKAEKKVLKKHIIKVLTRLTIDHQILYLME